MDGGYAHLYGNTMKMTAHDHLTKCLQIKKRKIERSFNTLILNNLSTEAFGVVTLKCLESLYQSILCEREAPQKELKLRRGSEKLLSEIQGMNRSNEENLQEIRQLMFKGDDDLLEVNGEGEAVQFYSRRFQLYHSKLDGLYHRCCGADGDEDRGRGNKWHLYPLVVKGRRCHLEKKGLKVYKRN